MHLTLLALALRVLACLNIILTFGDAFTTNAALRQPGVREANPIMAFAMRVLGSKWVIARFVFSLVGIISAVSPGAGLFALAALAVGDALVAYAVISNGKLAKLW